MFNNYYFIDLHRHLDGNLRIETIIDLAKQHKLHLPAYDKKNLIPHVRVTSSEPDLMSFISKFKYLQQVMVDYKAIERIASENVEDAYKEGIDYIELRFSPYFMSMEHGLDVDGVTEAVCCGVYEKAASLPIRVKLIVIMSRTFGPEKCFKELNSAIRYKDHGIVAIDLAGDEAGFPGSMFIQHFKKARDAGLLATAHAGEAAGAESVKQAITELGVRRIGHGIRSIDDPSVMNMILEKNIGLEVCPTSNLQTSTVSSYSAHPLKLFLNKGLLATLNTDDPGISGIDLQHEYRVVKKKMNLTQKEIFTLQQNALKVAFLSDAERNEIRLKVSN